MRAGRFGGHYVPWGAVAERASLAGAARALMAVLEPDANSLDRYPARRPCWGRHLGAGAALGQHTARPARLDALRVERERRLRGEPPAQASQRP